LLTGFIKNRFAGKDRKKPFSLKWVFYRGLTINLAKVLAKEKGIPFSMASCKTMIHNAYLLERFICVSGIKPNRRLNDKLVKELIEFAASAA
jgi:hypothetical protein